MLERDGLRCRMCGEMCHPAGAMKHRPAVDHVVPLRIAPERGLDPDNLRVTHFSCNSGRRANAVERTYAPRREW